MYPAMDVLNYALRQAAKNEDGQAILSLLAIRADPNAYLDFVGPITTPLLTAVRYCDIEIVKNLLQAGGSVYHPGLFSAAANSHKPIEMFRLMLEMGANIATSGAKALITAVLNKDLEAVEFLLLNGANVNHLDSAKFTALQLAIIKGNIELMKMLLDAGPDINASPYPDMSWSGEQTALHSTVAKIDRSNL